MRSRYVCKLIPVKSFRSRETPAFYSFHRSEHCTACTELQARGSGPHSILGHYRLRWNSLWESTLRFVGSNCCRASRAPHRDSRDCRLNCAGPQELHTAKPKSDSRDRGSNRRRLSGAPHCDSRIFDRAASVYTRIFSVIHLISPLGEAQGESIEWNSSLLRCAAPPREREAGVATQYPTYTG